MDRRIETRFKVQSSLKVAVLRDPDRELECFLTDISGNGMRFVAGESLLEGEIIVAEAGEHILLAEVRNSQPRGDKYVVGVQRIQAVLKGSLPEGSTRIEQIETLIKGLRSQVQTDPTQALEAAAERVLAAWENLTPGADRKRDVATPEIDGNSVPVFLVQYSSTPDGDGNTTAQVQFSLGLVGNHPLRNLSVRLMRATAYDPEKGAVGPVIFHRVFDTFSGQGEDWKGLSGPHDLKGERAVFQANFAARNGDWNQVIKMRRVNSAWESRSAVFRNLGAARPIQGISDEVSPNFPEAERRLPIIPVTAEDVGT